MKVIGDGKKSGRYTGMKITEFANAVIHGLRDHPNAEHTSDDVIILPIDEATWQETFKIEFPDNTCKAGHGQLLTQCRSYYNQGKHGMGYDCEGRFDFGKEKREKTKDSGLKGREAKPRVRSGHHAKEKLVKPKRAIQMAYDLWNIYFGEESFPVRTQRKKGDNRAGLNRK